ncbi:MAG: efflux RND transporter periplasmic adaptor subunit [Candidatus Aminicenantes bacterium]|nr:efflux RND transporter periplasmic adaptor subunit [Candidatus Aminicenantes bacterium]
MNRRSTVLILTSALSLMTVVFSGCSKDKKNGEEAAAVRQPIQVKVEAAGKGVFIKKLNYKGTVQPWKRAHIGPNVSGRIAKIYKKQGDSVKKGTLLAELDTTTMDLQKKQVQAALAVAEAAYKDARLNYERIKTLYEKEAVSQLQYEKAQLGLETADTQKKSVQANLDMVEHNLDNSYMKAPFSGIITSKNLEEGDMINPMMGMTAGALTLMDLSKVKLNIDVPAEDIEKIRIGQDCTVKVNSLPDENFKGKVYSRNLAADPVSKTFKVEVEIDNPDIKIKAGVFAAVQIEILRKENTLLLPHSAVIDDNKIVLLDNGKAKIIEVTVGDRNDRFYEILGGLEPGQLVVVEGNYDLKDGAPITRAGEDK